MPGPAIFTIRWERSKPLDAAIVRPFLRPALRRGLSTVLRPRRELWRIPPSWRNGCNAMDARACVCVCVRVFETIFVETLDAKS